MYDYDISEINSTRNYYLLYSKNSPLPGFHSMGFIDIMVRNILI